MTQEEFDRVEKEFLNHLKMIQEDISKSIENLRPNSGLVKSELCLAFVGADTFSRIYKIFSGKSYEELDSDIRGRFITWINKFVLTKQNKAYRENYEHLKCDAESLWKLRNSLIHFYGLPRPDSRSGEAIVLVVNDPKKFRGMRKTLAKQSGRKFKLIHPHHIVDILQYGLLTQLQEMIQMMGSEPQTYIQKVILAHQILGQESGVFYSANQKR